MRLHVHVFAPGNYMEKWTSECKLVSVRLIDVGGIYGPVGGLQEVGWLVVAGQEELGEEGGVQYILQYS